PDADSAALGLPTLPGDADQVEVVGTWLRRTLRLGPPREDPRLAEAMVRLRRELADPTSRSAAMVDGADHHGVARDPVDGVARWGRFFDQAVRRSPERSVALYSHGDPDLLRAATDAVVTRLRDWGLVRRGARVLDLGCGIGRVAAALAPEVGEVLGL